MILIRARHGLYQQEPTQHNTTSEICWLLCTQQPTFVQLVVVYPTTNIHNFISWCCVPNTSNCWVVLCTQLFSKKIQHEKRIISASRVFLLFKKQACYASFKFLKQVQQIMTIFEMFDLKLGQMLHNPTVMYPTTKLTKC